MKFVDLGLTDETLKAVTESGYETPTPIQAMAIPPVLMGRDVLACAQTGTGKTASFTLPMIDILSGSRAKARMPRSLILAPTRELAMQIAENFENYGKYHKLEMALLIGGMGFDAQAKKVDKGVDVLIATPGRLMDLHGRGGILLNDVKVFVIDEADRMLDMGFIPDIEKIVGFLPTIRQTLMFSATMPNEIRRLADKFLLNPKEITITAIHSTADTVAQFAVKAGKGEKRQKLMEILAHEKPDQAVIFCNRKKDIDGLHRFLRDKGHKVGFLHGDLAQRQRLKVLEEFKEGQLTLLIASDVAARGLDIDDLSHVFNFDVPMNPEDYVHRIGRTGRAGKTGRAITLVGAEDSNFYGALCAFLKKELAILDMKSSPAPQSVPKQQSAASKPASPKPQAQKSPAPVKEQKSSPPTEKEEKAAGFGDDVPAFLKR